MPNSAGKMRKLDVSTRRMHSPTCLLNARSDQDPDCLDTQKEAIISLGGRERQRTNTEYYIDAI